MRYRAPKNILITLLLLFTIAAVCSCGELAVDIVTASEGVPTDTDANHTISSDTDKANDDTVTKPESKDTSADAPTDTKDAQSGQPSEGKAAGNEEPQNPSSMPSKYSFPLFNETDLVFHVDDSLFSFFEVEINWMFYYIPDEAAMLEISYVFAAPLIIDELASGLLYNYLDDGEVFTEDNRSIANSPLSGYYAAGINGETTYEVWLYSISDLTSEGLALAIVTSYQNEDQKKAIYDILDSMEIAGT